MKDYKLAYEASLYLIGRYHRAYSHEVNKANKRIHKLFQTLNKYDGKGEAEAARAVEDKIDAEMANNSYREGIAEGLRMALSFMGKPTQEKLALQEHQGENQK